MKILFLDIDGVLNTPEFLIKKKDSKSMDPKAVDILNKITNITKCKLIISSSWRHLYPTLEENICDFKLYNIQGDIIGRTPSKDFVVRNQRGKEISSYIRNSNHAIDDFLILDDDSDVGKLKNKLILTDSKTGLLDCHKNKIIEIFNK